MMATSVAFRRALILMTMSSALVPVIGIATAPILTQSLGVAARGEMAAAIAPGLLLASAATLGLPEALTFHLARRPDQSRMALGWASAISVAIGVVSFLIVLLAVPFLSGGDRQLADLIILATALSVPSLLVTMLRGAAAGRHMWTALTAEKILNGTIRLVLLAAFAVAGQLDVLNAMLIVSIAPVVSGFVYWRLVLSPGPAPITAAEVEVKSRPGLAVSLVAFGSKIWLGSVATMVMARLAQFLVVPLSDVTQLGILVVAITIADVPFILTATIRDVLFSADSVKADPQRLALVSRLTIILTALGSMIIGLSLPLWISILFGQGFQAAIVPTWLTLASQVMSVPILMAGAGFASSGHPGRRSTALIIALMANGVGLLVLVPLLGAVGAASAGVLGNAMALAYSAVLIQRSIGISGRELLIPRASDFVKLRTELRHVLRRLTPTRWWQSI